MYCRCIIVLLRDSFDCLQFYKCTITTQFLQILVVQLYSYETVLIACSCTNVLLRDSIFTFSVNSFYSTRAPGCGVSKLFGHVHLKKVCVLILIVQYNFRVVISDYIRSKIHLSDCRAVDCTVLLIFPVLQYAFYSYCTAAPPVLQYVSCLYSTADLPLYYSILLLVLYCCSSCVAVQHC